MSDKKDTHAIDRDELGSVETVHDLEPDSDIGPSRKSHEQDRTMNATTSGYFEIEGGSKSGLGTKLRLGEEIKKDGGSRIREYETAYNSYSIPLRSTLRSLGRVKDVSITGAPMTPTELMKRPELAAKFGTLNNKHMTVEQELAYNGWSKSQTKLKHDVKRFGAGQQEFSAVILDFQRAKSLLAERRTEAQKAAKTEELAKIVETAETLVKIVDVSLEAWSAMGEIEEAIEAKTAFSEAAEGDAGIEHLPHGTTPSWDKGTADDPYADNARAGTTKRQKLAGAAQGVGEMTAMGGRIAKNVAAQVAKSGDFNMSFKDAAILLDGDGQKYAQLQKDIIKLDGHIKELQLDQEGKLVRAATDRLNGFSMEFSVRKEEVQTDRVEARQDARTFAESVGGGPDMIDAMYAAEAFQELAQFGRLAAAQRRSMVDPLWGGAHTYVHSYDKHRFLAIGAAEDAMVLDENLRAVKDQGRYFASNLPRWQDVATQWSEFLGEHGSSPLTLQRSEADEKTDAP